LTPIIFISKFPYFRQKKKEKKMGLNNIVSNTKVYTIIKQKKNFGNIFGIKVVHLLKQNTQIIFKSWKKRCNNELRRDIVESYE